MLKVRAAYMISLALACMAVACSFEDSAVRCQGDNECTGADRRCYEGFCIPSARETSSSPQKGSDGGTAGSRSNTSTSSNGGRSGGGASATGGRGGGGSPRPTTDAGAKDPIPADASVGGDCSRDGEERPCLVDPTSTTAAETCNRGTQTCSEGGWSACSAQPMPEAETCNGRDDDCNGVVDNLLEVCFPEGQTGCTQGADGSWACAGACGTGTRTCRDGALTECAGATTPAEETCTPENMVARNEDCDDVTDEGCDCRSGETRSCWSGRAETMNVGRCKAGMQTCSDGAFGACTGEVNADAESCANATVDDDCNGTVDDVPTVGDRCQVAGAQGPCANGTLSCSGNSGPTCVSTITPAPETCNALDDNCNGRADETFNLRSDAQNCGACGNRCEAGQVCCSGRCANTTNNTSHCGACGNRCTDGQRCNRSMCMSTGMPMAGMPPTAGAGTGGSSGAPAGGAGAGGTSGSGGSNGSQCTPACGAGETCCNGACVNTNSNALNCGTCGRACGVDSGCCSGECTNFLSEQNCGRCDYDCSLLGEEGVTCACTKDDSGVIACRGPVLGLCL